MILAGTPDLVDLSSGAWAFLDVGFSREASSCGLRVPDEAPYRATFDAARKRLCILIAKSNTPVNLVIEAPLSVAFTSLGNPTGRTIESRDKSRRYWYIGAGCSVMVAALYIIQDLAAVKPSVSVRLFEGFVSFKHARSDHLADVSALSAIVADPTAHPLTVVAAEDLKVEPTDTIESAGRLCGVDFGVPAVLIAEGEPIDAAGSLC